MVSMLASLLMLLFILVWFVRHGTQMSEILINLRADMEALQNLFANAGDAVTQVPSHTAGYMLFVVVLAVYGGLAILGLWALWESRGQKYVPEATEYAQTQRVRRAMGAGLRELQEHTDPRQAIIACYARLEHLLMDYGMPVAQHLTPQEYMSTALQDLDLPLDIFADLVRLFELARYSLYPLDDAARTKAITHLEQLKAHLEGESAYAAQP